MEHLLPSPQRQEKSLLWQVTQKKDGVDQNLALRATYPAASIFKLVTAAAALEKGKVEPDTVINFRGGTLCPFTWKLDR